MKIAFDASSLIYGTGVAVYTKNLIQNLVRINKNHKFILFGGSLRRSAELKRELKQFEGPNVEIKVFTLAPSLADIVWNKFHLYPIEKLIGEVDVFHSSDWSQPPSKAFKVTTVHDLIPVMHPEMSHPRIISVHKKRLQRVKEDVDRVIVPSSQTAEDAVLCGIDLERIRVIPEALSPEFGADILSESQLRSKFLITDKYLLAIGTAPRKNLGGIVAAFKKVKKERNLQLVVVGELNEETEKYKGKGILFLGKVEDKYLASLYKYAEVLVYPSFYEGFGLPILEAYSMGTPVVTSKIGSMHTVSGHSSIFVKPGSPESIAIGIRKAFRHRNSWAKKGLERLKEFSWEQTAQKTMAVYEESIKRK